MNQSAIAAYLETRLATLTDVKGVQPGLPDSSPSLPAEYPFVYYEVGEPAQEWISFGGWVSAPYDVTITLVLGAPDTQPIEAQQLKWVWADRLRSLLTPDPTLGGLCFDSNLTQGSNNLGTFARGAGSDKRESYPSLAYRLTVVEHTLASAGASG